LFKYDCVQLPRHPGMLVEKALQEALAVGNQAIKCQVVPLLDALQRRRSHKCNAAAILVIVVVGITVTVVVIVVLLFILIVRIRISIASNRNGVRAVTIANQSVKSSGANHVAAYGIL